MFTSLIDPWTAGSKVDVTAFEDADEALLSVRYAIKALTMVVNE